MITFKEIEMTGFKSFADTTKISFDGGITAIVGPNGCGKTSVFEAFNQWYRMRGWNYGINDALYFDKLSLISMISIAIIYGAYTISALMECLSDLGILFLPICCRSLYLQHYLCCVWQSVQWLVS